MRVAAVDYGRRRIGLAVCDPLGINASLVTGKLMVNAAALMCTADDL